MTINETTFKRNETSTTEGNQDTCVNIQILPIKPQKKTIQLETTDDKKHIPNTNKETYKMLKKKTLDP